MIKLNVCCLLFLPIVLFSQQLSGDKERMITALKQSGIVRQEGNTLIYKVRKASDSAQAKLLYGNLFNDPLYTVRFEVEGQKPVPTKTPLTKKSGNEGSGIASNTLEQSSASQSVAGCNFCKLKTFAYVGASSNQNSLGQFTEHTWTVPAGTTIIKLHGWSAGGDGWSEIAVNRRFTYGTDTSYTIIGGGGGAGAFVETIVTVTPGDLLKIRIPAGGSGTPLIVQFSNAEKGTLNVESGHNAKSTSGPIQFDGIAGKLYLKTGVFAENTFSLRGGDGQESWISNYENKNNAAPVRSSDVSAPSLQLHDNFEIYGGHGGNAAHSVTGGVGVKRISPAFSIIAKDGGYPGGGGGSGWKSNRPVTEQPDNRNGKGAAGLLVIYY